MFLISPMFRNRDKSLLPETEEVSCVLASVASIHSKDRETSSTFESASLRVCHIVLQICIVKMSQQNVETTRYADRAIKILERLYSERDETGDVTFIVESKSIRAHRFVLAAVSPKYQTQFYGSNPDGDLINIEDVSAAAFEEFLEFFYKENINLSVENAEMVLDLAKQSLVDDFVNTCDLFLIETVNLDNLCSSYRLAISYDLKLLRCLCEDQFKMNIKEIYGGEEFLQCDRDVLLAILKLDFLRCTETEVFDACISWAHAALEVANPDDVTVEKLREILGDVVHQIRFTSMEPQEFEVLHKRYEGFFTPDESAEIFHINDKMGRFNSGKFNLTPRYGCSMLEVDRISNRSDFSISQSQYRSSDHGDHTWWYDRITFNKPICLRGFAYANRSKIDGSVFSSDCAVLRTKYNDPPTQMVVSKCTIVQVSNIETTFLLEEPIYIFNTKSPFKYSLRINSFIQSYQLVEVKGLSLKGRQRIDVNGIEFEFFERHITRLLFDELDVN